jgi:hypothetical protein
MKKYEYIMHFYVTFQVSDSPYFQNCNVVIVKQDKRRIGSLLTTSDLAEIERLVKKEYKNMTAIINIIEIDIE